MVPPNASGTERPERQRNAPNRAAESLAKFPFRLRRHAPAVVTPYLSYAEPADIQATN